MSELAKAKNAVMKEVGYVQKERKQGLNYSFAGEAALIEALRPEMVKHGLVISPEKMELVKLESFSTSKGTPMTRVIVAVQYRMTHAASGQFETVSALGEGMDSGDKATLKAMTVAYKYALRQGFLIETGDDPDNTPSTAYEDRKPQQQPAQQTASQGIDWVVLRKNMMSCQLSWADVVEMVNKRGGHNYAPTAKGNEVNQKTMALVAAELAIKAAQIKG